MKPKIIFFDAKPYDQHFFDQNNITYQYPITYIKSHLNRDTAHLAKGYLVVCAFVNDKIDSATIEMLQTVGVQLVALRSAGYNNVDLKAIYKKIHVVRVPEYSPPSIAEHAVALMLCLNRKIHKAYARIREGNFSLQGLLGFNLHGKTIGIVGTGRIGRVVIHIMKGFGMRVLAYDVFPDEGLSQQEGFQYVDLPELYRSSDIISLHCPLNKDTYHLISEESIALMKKGVMIINTGRGKLIKTEALIEALKTQKIGSAGLDVYEEESEYFFEDFSNSVIQDDMLARLIAFQNVLVTSHQGFFTEEALTHIAQTTLQNIEDYFENRPLKNEICYRCENKCQFKIRDRCF